jgi:diguanylate cyclase (GGDEF)-like protein
MSELAPVQFLSIKTRGPIVKLARFQHFASRLQELVSEQENMSAADLFRHFDGKWFLVDGSAVLDEELIKRLDITRKDGNHWRKKKEKAAYFKLNEIDSVVEVSFGKPPAEKTREAADKNIKKFFEIVNQDFDVHHDDLTGCNNRKAFDKRLVEVISSTKAVPVDGTTKIGSATSSFVHLLSLDIDFFKRVNDKFGHAYGDVVLRAFVWRVEETCETLSKELGNQVDIFFARLGGEEFQILISGNQNTEQVAMLAERIRRAVENSPVPTSDEFCVIQRDGLGMGELLPIDSERGITTSIGVATAPTKSDRKQANKIGERLKSQADLALYSAKQGGRNRVRVFSEILNKYGRIIEHHKETDIVAIDIGSELGVQQGQEFFVIHPQYSGENGFYLDDGRSRRRLGTYPRVNIGRISVFDVQNEISFCRVSARTTMDGFSSGCWLESIPLGSIGHLVASTAGFLGRGRLFDAEDVKKHISGLVKEEVTFAVLVCGLKDIISAQQKFGTRHVNEMLASAHRILVEELPSKARIAQLEPGSFAIALEYDRKNVVLDAVRTCSKRTDEAFGGNDQLCFGAFFSSPENRENVGFRPDPARAFDFAAIAATVAITERVPVQEFTLDAPLEVLKKASEEGAYARGLADYSKFKELGISSVGIENQAGILAFESGDMDVAEGYFRRAVELDKSNSIIRANLGLTQFRKMQWKQCFESLSEARKLEAAGEMDLSYSGAMAYAYWKSLSTELPVDRWEHAVKLFEEALASAPEKFPWVPETVLRESLDRVRNQILSMPVSQTRDTGIGVPT